MSETVPVTSPVTLPVISPVTLPYSLPAWMFAFVSVRLPLDAPVASVVANLTLFVLSSQPMNTLSSSPRSITIPASPLAEPVLPVPSL